MSHARCLLVLIGACVLVACGANDEQDRVMETVGAKDLLIEMPAKGVLKATQSTPLPVPGSNWARRQLAWHVPDGSMVKQGDVVAKFRATRSVLDREQARIDLLRNQLLQQAKQNDLTQSLGRVDVDLAGVQTDLTIAETYADAELAALSRNQVLDAIADRAYLGEKKSVLYWQRGQSGSRTTAEMAVLRSQETGANQRFENSDKDLQALDLRAPHDGVFVLETDWSGEKPQLGANMYASAEFARIPDTGSFEVEFSVPVQDATPLKVGQAVKLFPSGRPDQAVAAQLDWIATTPQQQGRQNPIKMIKFKAKVPRNGMTAAWVPGQGMEASIVIAQGMNVLSVPNLALDSSGKGDAVFVLERGKTVKRAVQLGARGSARSVVMNGLKAGERICVLAKDCAG